MAAPQGQLSPLGAEEEGNGSAGVAPPKPRRRRQRPVTDENVDAAESGAVEGTIEGEIVPPQKPKRRRPKAAPVTSGEGTTENPEDNVDGTIDGTTIDGTVDGEAPQRRRRKKKRPQGEAAGADPSGTQRGQTNFALDLNLDDLKDDIVVLSPTTINVSATASTGQLADATYTKSVGPLRTATGTAAAPIQSQLTTKPGPISSQQPTSQNDTSVYIEERSKFRKTDKEQLQKEAEARLQMQVAERRKSLLDAALLAHSVVAKFALFCEGFLAGFAFWHIIVVAIMMNTLNYTPLNTFLFQFYGPFSNAASTIYFFLLYFALLNSMDRIDIASISRKCGLKCATFQIPGICIIMYLIALILHMVCVPIEDQMWVGYYTPSSLNATTTYSSTLSGLITGTWYPMSIGRAILVIFSWFLLAVYPYKDRLKENLIKHKSDQDEFESDNMQPLGGRATEA